MPVLDIFKIGIRSLISHKLRSVLSTLGVVFGVAAVVSMLSIGEGAKREALEQIRLMGTNNIIVRALPLSDQQKREAQQNLSQGVTLGDAERIAEIVPGIQGVSVFKQLLSVARYEDRETPAHLVSTTPDYLSISGLRIASGRFITNEDLENRNNVSVLGWKKKEALFPGENPIGKTITVGGQLRYVVGVLENRDQPQGKNLVVQVRDINNDIYVPLDATGLAKDTPINEILVQVTDSEQVLNGASVIQSILTRLHHQVNDYELIVPQELLNQSQRTQRIFSIVMGSIAGISLLVGGIGIMNIMLAVITERTREIGIRRALGANKRDILRQFLVETMVLSLSGGVIGVLLGASGARLINYYVGWLTIVSFNAVSLAFFVSVITGVVFGMYPAYKAANMNPIEALRYE